MEADRSAVLAQLADRIAAVEQTAPPAGSPAGPTGDSRSRPPRRRRGPDTEPAATPGHPEDDPGDPVAVAKAVCLRLLAVSARTRAGLAEALQRRGVPDDAARIALDRLTEVGLIDDAAYAEAFVRTKHRDRGLGRTALAAELRRKGVDGAMAAEAAAAVDPDDERRRATELVRRRLDSVMAAGPEAARRRLAGLLARRGYPPGLVYEVVDRAVQGHLDRQPDE
ncbi:regulatory protein RecX [Nakamurella leprariae]|uniref:Regulatory protein RecX n=1 Tax=Nakamurella leprariae TaxID=2803911 RepID=A0A939C3A5_9ACTN|nr:regulatory protein RecX [Nakamurella leprariae]MBM9469209.1 regulatory protein RecX [Nakamurella leprariae]